MGKGSRNTGICHLKSAAEDSDIEACRLLASPLNGIQAMPRTKGDRCAPPKHAPTTIAGAVTYTILSTTPASVGSNHENSLSRLGVNEDILSDTTWSDLALTWNQVKRGACHESTAAYDIAMRADVMDLLKVNDDTETFTPVFNLVME